MRLGVSYSKPNADDDRILKSMMVGTFLQSMMVGTFLDEDILRWGHSRRVFCSRLDSKVS